MRDDQIITGFGGHFLYTGQHRSNKITVKLMNNDADRIGLLFSQVAVLGVAWLRIASAAVVFAIWRRPWRLFRGAGPSSGTVTVGVVVGCSSAATSVVLSMMV